MVMTLNPDPRVAVPTFGRHLLDTVPAALRERPIVLTQPEPWAMVAHLFDPERTSFHFVRTMEHARVREVSASFGPATAVFGIGGGSALDHAKYVAWSAGLPLVLVPTILSVDAAFTKAIGVREGARVRYVGEVWPAHLLIDFRLLETAPRVLNLAGTGDILSIFTALWDWREAGRRLGEPYDEAVAARSRELLARLIAGAPWLRDGTDNGLRLLADLYVEEVRLCEIVGSSRPEEGSEHYLAYCVESLTGGHYVHGQLVGACILIAGLVQGQDVTPIATCLRAVGLDCSPAAIGVARAEFRRALLHVHDYVRQEAQLLPGVFHFAPVAQGDADRVLEKYAGLV
jgi:glycerol-1-phosphate dehydrogenase [NAD(P)+]